MIDQELGRRFELDELLDLSATGELIRILSSVLGLRIRIYDREHKELFKTGEEDIFCSLITSSQGGEALCQGVKERLLTQPVSGSSALQVQSACGAKYAVFSIQHQFESLGRVIVGPYQDARLSDSELEAIAQRHHLDPGKFRIAYRELPSLSSEQLKKNIRFLSKFFEVFIFINAKRLITTIMHLNMIMQNRDKIFAQIEKETKGTPEDVKEIDKYKDMF